MADVKMIATRESYGNTLKALAAEGHDDLVVLDADLAAATKTGMFRKAYPNRHFDCGIAEANMMGVAAGLSTMGYVPFVSSFAMFAAGRAFEQIRNSVAYPRLNVKIGATHGGISVGEDGASHQCCEDFALMRSHARHDHHLPRRRCGGPGCCPRCLRDAGAGLPPLRPSGRPGVPRRGQLPLRDRQGRAAHRGQ